ncbi:ZNF277 (predicted) [Pycnogonum litorale]
MNSYFLCFLFASSWDDWKSNDDIGSFCLFCKYSTSDIDDLQAHLLNKHKFDLMQIKEKMNLDFYLKVKLINYIRRQVHQRRCINCDEKFDDTSSLMIHMTVTAHINQLPDKSIWDQSQYLFPTYENDNLLHSIEDKDDEKSFDTTKMIPVIPEDDKITPNESILIDDNLRSNLF